MTEEMGKRILKNLEHLPPETLHILASLKASEPVFILRAQDVCGANTIKAWIYLAGQKGLSLDKQLSAEVALCDFEIWAQTADNRTKRPD